MNGNPMHTPDFFSAVRAISLHDPLAAFLGAMEGGLIEYNYTDAVKLAGHSCPTVAGAYLATLMALNHLYPGATPQRGEIKVSFRESSSSGVTGVMANIATLITGATQDNGFKGIGGKFDRRNLLFFDVPMSGEMRFERRDTGSAVSTSYHPEIVPPDPAMKELMQAALMGTASPQEQKEFARLWQERVKRILIDHIDDPRLVVLD
jgi:formylmethanofuran dehydrogenase subunit E